MTGNNHYLDCTCGWCAGGGRGSSRTVVATAKWYDSAPPWPSARATESSYTDPNAKCPVCGAAVFFYRSPYGGRVFFDELGPPWSKHPCTDTPGIAALRVPKAVGTSANAPQWKNMGWEPVIIDSVDRVEEWAILKIRRFNGPGYIVRATPWRDGLARDCPAHFKPLDAFGVGRISFLLPTESGFKPVSQRLTHRTLTKSSPRTVSAAHKGNLECATEVAFASFKPWAQEVPGSPKLRYPAFVDFSISRRWLEWAASLGSAEAQSAIALKVDLPRKK